MKDHFYVYLLTNKKEGRFYVGMTSDLPKRIWEHKSKIIDGFTKKYNLDQLVYYEVFDDADNAIRREKRLKRWNRDWKIQAVEELNPSWEDLYAEICA